MLLLLGEALSAFLMILKTERRQQKRTAFLTAEKAICSTKYRIQDN